MFCAQCGTKNEDNSRFCFKCGATLSATGIQGAQREPGEQETVILTVPKCEKKKRLSGRTEFYNLMITTKRIVGAKTGGTFFGTRGLAGALVSKIEKDKQDINKFSNKELEEILNLDENNWAVPFSGFEEIKVSKQLGQPYIRFKLNREGKGHDSKSAVPDLLSFDKEYLEGLQTTLKDLVGASMKT